MTYGFIELEEFQKEYLAIGEVWKRHLELLFVHDEISQVQSSIQLDSDDVALVRLQVSTDANDISLIEGLPFLWTLGNSTNGVSSSNGTSTVQANGFLEKSVDYPCGGEIVFDYDSQSAPFWMFMSPSSITIDLLPFPEENNNGGEQNSGNDVTNPLPDPELISLSI